MLYLCSIKIKNNQGRNEWLTMFYFGVVNLSLVAFVDVIYVE